MTTSNTEIWRDLRTQKGLTSSPPWGKSALGDPLPSPPSQPLMQRALNTRSQWILVRNQAEKVKLIAINLYMQHNLLFLDFKVYFFIILHLISIE